MTLYVDSIPVETALDYAKITNQTDLLRRYWASNQRLSTSTHREILEIRFPSERALNRLEFDLSRFPCHYTVEYQDSRGHWQPLTHSVTLATRKGRKIVHTSVKHNVQGEIHNPVPAILTVKDAGKTQHQGHNHWKRQDWKLSQTRTSRLRIIFTRLHGTSVLRNSQGKQIPYSIAVRNLKVGYCVLARNDIPKPSGTPTPTQDPPPWWASSNDILGSQVVYQTYTQDASNLLDGKRSTSWKCEPQPFPWAVVSLYLDTRGIWGTPSVIDRFWVDPLTPGVPFNLYYSNDDPTGDYIGTDDAIPASAVTVNSYPTITDTGSAYRMDLTGSTAGVSVAESYLKLNYYQPWWVGLDACWLEDPSGGSSGVLNVGPFNVTQSGTTLTVQHSNGAMISLPLDTYNTPRVGQRFRLVLSSYEGDPNTGRSAYFRLSYQAEGEDAVSQEMETTQVWLVGDILVANTPSAANGYLGVYGMVIKDETLDDEVESDFLALGEADVYSDDPYSVISQNAILRMHPAWVTASNPYGLVGGEGERFGDMSWTPINQDYVLSQGIVDLPPTAAKFWKFEFSGLVAQTYEATSAIERDVLVFPPDVVNGSLQHNRSQDAPSGVASSALVSTGLAYSDVTSRAVPTPTDPSVTDVLTIKSPDLAAQAKSLNWVWGYQPWHVGSRIPRFSQIGQHYYEQVSVNHADKVAYFVGVRELVAYRTDYTFADDTPEYQENFLDTNNFDTVAGFDQNPGQITSQSVGSRITSKVFQSYRPVRGVQFATIESDMIQVLPDTQFNDPDRWAVYGDAQITHGPEGITISRGWLPSPYLSWETSTYGDLETNTYASMEGVSSLSADGGVISETYSPPNFAKLVATARIGAGYTLHAPVILEIVASVSGEVVASDSVNVYPGTTQDMQIEYTPAPLVDLQTYADVETLGTTYGALEGNSYGLLEAVDYISPYYVRVRQAGQNRDSFVVNSVQLFSSFMSWEFSNDGGASWYRAEAIKNKPDGVMLFPHPSASAVGDINSEGRGLVWRVTANAPGVSVSALRVRPWYSGTTGGIGENYELASGGPTQAMRDYLPRITEHPMWVEPKISAPTRATGATSPSVVRNLLTNPTGSGGAAWVVDHGTSQAQQTWQATTTQNVLLRPSQIVDGQPTGFNAGDGDPNTFYQPANMTDSLGTVTLWPAAPTVPIIFNQSSGFNMALTGGTDPKTLVQDGDRTTYFTSAQSTHSGTLSYVPASQVGPFDTLILTVIWRTSGIPNDAYVQLPLNVLMMDFDNGAEVQAYSNFYGNSALEPSGWITSVMTMDASMFNVDAQHVPLNVLTSKIGDLEADIYGTANLDPSMWNYPWSEIDVYFTRDYRLYQVADLNTVVKPAPYNLSTTDTGFTIDISEVSIQVVSK